MDRFESAHQENPEISPMNLAALVVTCNEERLLDDCLQSLAGCSPLIVVDLESSDGSARIAHSYTSQVYSHKWVAIAEFVIPDVLELIPTDWFIRLDPDEVLPAGILEDISSCIQEHPDAAIIVIPSQYHFLRKPLTTTAWGGVNLAPRVYHKDRIAVNEWVHVGIKPKENYTVARLAYNGHNALKHFWVDSIEMLNEKHDRYILLEGKTRYEQGQRFSWLKFIYFAVKALLHSLVRRKGWLGGWDGWFLSLFFAQYEARAWLSLRRYQTQLTGTMPRG